MAPPAVPSAAGLVASNIGPLLASSPVVSVGVATDPAVAVASQPLYASLAVSGPSVLQQQQPASYHTQLAAVAAAAAAAAGAAQHHVQQQQHHQQQQQLAAQVSYQLAAAAAAAAAATGHPVVHASPAVPLGAHQPQLPVSSSVGQAVAMPQAAALPALMASSCSVTTGCCIASFAKSQATAGAAMALQEQQPRFALSTAAVPRHVMSQQPQQHSLKHRAFIGIVTKIADAFGVVDDEVYFKTSVCKGAALPKVNDRVLVEATFDAGLGVGGAGAASAAKWNVTRVQILLNQPAPQHPASQKQYQQYYNHHPQVQPLRNSIADSSASATTTTAAVTSGIDVPSAPASLLQLPASCIQPLMHPAAPSITSTAGTRALSSAVVSQMSVHGNRTVPTDIVKLAADYDVEKERPPLAAATMRRQRSPPSPGTASCSHRWSHSSQASGACGSPPKPSAVPHAVRLPKSRCLGGMHQEEDRDIGAAAAPRRQSRRRSRSIGPKQPTAKYCAVIPKLPPHQSVHLLADLWSRYPNLYVPGDCASVANSWTASFPLRNPCRLDRPVRFHILGACGGTDLRLPVLAAVPLGAHDSNHTFSAKVMLLALPPLDELYFKSCAEPESDLDAKARCKSGRERREDADADRRSSGGGGGQHPARLIRFLVGLRGNRREPLAIGGAWSPSLDGADPVGDPSVLVRTAIRTTKALIGVDLSCCTRWHKFTEIRYERPEEVHRGKVLPARTETTVIFLPDVWSCTPSLRDWQSCIASHKLQLRAAAARAAEPGTAECTGGSQPQAAAAASAPSEDSSTMQCAETHDACGDHLLDAASNKIIVDDAAVEPAAHVNAAASSCRTSVVVCAEATGLSDAPAHESPVAASVEPRSSAMASTPAGDVEEYRKLEEEQISSFCATLDSLAEEPPGILVQPRRNAKGGKFDCALMSLNVLLDYRREDKKEHLFEIAVFAEAFNEMLMRDLGFIIFKRLLYASTLPPSEDEAQLAAGSRKNVDWRRRINDDDDQPSKRRKTEDDSDTDDGDSRNGSEAYGLLKDRRTSEFKSQQMDAVSAGSAAVAATAAAAAGIDRCMLLAFAYFDLGRTGYLLSRDVEDLVHAVGLGLSRIQVKTIVQASASRDCVHYRRLAERCSSYSDEALHNHVRSDARLKTAGLATAAEPRTLISSEADVQAVQDSSDNAARESADDDVLAGGSDEVVPYRGMLVNVAGLLARLSQSEDTRAELERKLSAALANLDRTRDQLGRSAETCENLSARLSCASARVDSLVLANDRVEATSRHAQDTLQRSHQSLQRLLADIERALGERPATVALPLSVQPQASRGDRLSTVTAAASPGHCGTSESSNQD